MGEFRQRTGSWTRGIGAAALALLIMGGIAHGQSASGASAGSAGTQKGANRVELDRVVAVVNGDLILQSDIDDEERFEAFQPFRDQIPPKRDEIINRLIDRDLILQQAKLQAEPPIPEAQVDAELATLRKTIPECAQYHCESDAGWAKYCADHGFTVQEVHDRWEQRMEVLRFIEQRFRMGIRIPQADIDAYYKNTLLPAYAKRGATAPPEKTISARIQQILLEQQVGKLLDDWLTALRAQGSVRILRDGGTTTP